MSRLIEEEEAPQPSTSVPSHRLRRGWIFGDPVIFAGTLMIVAQLALRGEALSRSWFQFDDFAFMSRIMNNPLKDVVLEPYAGHVMPAGFFLSWLNHRIDPLNWAYPASELFLMQALASVGCLVLLVKAFGSRPGILPPLAIYLFSVITLPAFIWWAAGINQVPMQVAFFWGTLAHLTYLRTRHVRWAVVTMLIVLGGLAFYEKTLLLFGVFGILALAYFATGDIVARLHSVWRRYRVGVLLYGLVAVGYVIFYVNWGLNFSPNNANENPLGPVFLRIVVWGFGTGVLGGPLQWDYPTDLFAIASPTQLTVVAACVVLFAIGLEMVRTRTRAKRAWLIPGFLLTCDVLLVVAGRAGFVGPAIAQDYRYQTEVAGAAALALALALLPLRGAVESAEPIRPSSFFDVPRRVAGVTAVVVCLALVSSWQYTSHWWSAHESRRYFTNVAHDLESAREPVPLVDVGVPGYLMWAFAYPENATSHVLRMFAAHTRYVKVARDKLMIVSDSGRVAPVLIPPVRTQLPGPDACGYRVGRKPVTIPLNGPVMGAGWWVRVGYTATGNSLVTVRAGESTYQTRVEKGLHSLYFETTGEFRSIELSGLQPGTQLCTNDVTLGLPEAAKVRNR